MGVRARTVCVRVCLSVCFMFIRRGFNRLPLRSLARSSYLCGTTHAPHTHHTHIVQRHSSFRTHTHTLLITHSSMLSLASSHPRCVDRRVFQARLKAQEKEINKQKHIHIPYMHKTQRCVLLSHTFFRLIVSLSSTPTPT